jgi:single-stranded-DNA-specific exonuclease
MAAAVERLLRARDCGESVVIFGDYDVDGVTSTTLLLEALRPLGWKMNAYLPHRMDEGYGLSQDAVENCLKRHPSTLLLAVDCGSTAVGPVDWLRAQGVDVIVLDHHQVSSPAPDVTALVNPQLGDRFGELCSAGLAFKLAHAIVKRGRETGLPGADTFDLRPLLDLVALGTVADVVSLTGENRPLVSAGLERLNATRRPGLLALKRVAQCPPLLTTHEIGYQIAPRLNAAGRLETAEESLRLLLARDHSEAAIIAQKLDLRNRERQAIERSIAEEVIRTVQARFNAERDFVIVEGHADWHIGVVGIVASRVLHQFYRPTIILGGNGGDWRGSGRSIADFDLAAALRACGDLLVRHGGHAMAAGLTVSPEKVDAFRSRLNELAHRSLAPEQFEPSLRLDAEVRLPELTLDCLGTLDRLRPTGQGNPVIQFCARSVTLNRPPQRIGAEGQHVKLWITDGYTTHEAVWWSVRDSAMPSGTFDLAFVPQIHEYNGRRLVQLKVLDWQPAGTRSGHS